VATDLKAFIFNMNGHTWASKNNRSIRHIKEQNLYDPKPIGWLMRSTFHMTSSTELQDEMDRRAKARGHIGVYFGVTFKTIPMPGPRTGKYTYKGFPYRSRRKASAIKQWNV